MATGGSDEGDLQFKIFRSSSETGHHVSMDYPLHPLASPSLLGGGGGAGYPPVLVMYHPTMKTMATRLVKATTTRVDKLKLQSDVSELLQYPICMHVVQGWGECTF